MTSVVTSSDSRIAYIAGVGISIPKDFQLAPGIMIRCNPPRFELQVIANGCKEIRDYAAVIEMMEIASFYLEIENDTGGKELAAKTWNSLWLFPLLSLACQTPCTSLYSWSASEKVHFATATPHLISQAAIKSVEASTDQLKWACENLERFDALQKDETFSKALISYTNSHHLFGYSSRIMQLWSGIECLFRVSSEVSRTVAMYSALLLDEPDANARYDRFKEIRKEYNVRSKVVHGTVKGEKTLADGYLRASKLLAKLLSRCVELSHVPSSEELDRAALTSHIAI